MSTSNDYRGWKLVRTRAAFTDDTDHVDLQTAPTASERYYVTMRNAPASRPGGPTPQTVQVFVTWLNAANEVVTPDAGTTRGTFDLEILELVAGADGDSPPDPVTYIVDDTALTTCSGYKVYSFEGYPGSTVWPRLTNITEPTSGSPTQYQVWMRTVER